MKTLKLLALVAVLGLASLASAQTLTRSLVLKPAGALGTLTVSTGALTLLETYSITLPTNGSSLQGPIVKTSTATGNKTWTFGQIDLSLNAATTGDITGTLGVGNGGTGVTSITAGGIILGSGGTSPVTILAPGANTSVLTMSSGTPTWSDLDNLNTTAGAAPVTNINATDNNAGSGTESVTNIGYNVSVLDADDNASTTNINGNTTLGSLTGNDGNPTTLTVNSNTTFNGTVTLPLTTNYVWTGVGNVATELAPTANALFMTKGAGGLVPQWSTTLPTGLTIPTATITTPTITGGTINNTIIGGTTPAAGTFTNLAGTGTVGLNTSGTGTTTIGNNAGPSVTNIAGDINFTSTIPVNFTTMPELPLTLNNMYVGNASNYASELSTVASRVLTSTAGGVPTWTAVLPIANGGTNSSSIGGLGTVSYSTGTAYASTAVGTSGQILQSNGAGAPTWTNVGNLLAAASFTLTAVAADVTAGYLTVDVTTVPTLLTGYGYDASSRVMLTLESVLGPGGQVVTVTNRGAADFRIYTGALEVGDKVHVIIIDTTP